MKTIQIITLSLISAVSFATEGVGASNYNYEASLFTGERVANATDKCKIHVVKNNKGAMILRQSDFVNSINDRINIGVWFLHEGQQKKVHCYIEKNGTMKVEESRP